jgi:bifunctional DNA-binding transcriptional regulator/antitoxin component of YhaV-PrlF toxin-antitoxin module
MNMSSLDIDQSKTEYINNISVISRGQFTLPKEIRDRHDIAQGSLVIASITINETNIPLGISYIGESGRVTIPTYIIELLNITKDTTLDGEITPVIIS